MSSSADLLSKSTRGASLLVAGQLVTKLFTFLLNQVLIRYISPKVFGVSSYLEVLLSTALFFSREGVRLSIQRTEKAEELDEDDKIEEKKGNSGTSSKYVDHTIEGTHQSILNFGYVAIIVGVPISLILSYWQSNSQILTEQITFLAYNKQSLVLVWLSLVLELLVEPLYVLNQFQLDFGKRTKFESSATLARCISTFAVVLLGERFVKGKDTAMRDGVAVLAFSIGQFCYSCTIFILYQLDFRKLNKGEKLSLKIQKIFKSANSDSFYYFNPKIFLIWKNIFIQMVFKQFLTEGDRLLINYVCTVEEQGVYSVITNYGSLIARLLFQPIEESLRLYLTKLLSNPKSENVAISKQIMSYLSKFYLYLSILISIGGYTNGSFLLKMLLGKGASYNWLHTDLFAVFPQYILYIPFLAFNGILESFFNSVATKENIANHSVFMSISTVIFLSASYFFIEYLKLGLSGLILANTVNMTIRIIYCAYFIQQYYKKLDQQFDIKSVTKSILLPLGVGVVTEHLQYYILHQKLMTLALSDFFKSLALCLTFLMFALFLERHLILSAISSFLKKNKTD
ncbi:oligosaccharide translocation protein Rft1p [[Candida] railenensis]|uniref:Man(5)GlcNAc(2)-PP-dolichol translocation protein RFT1 n=1 Tax=[Candida] railenensis TaxID=45579 RepID=A0A9P0QPG0_9ASCO|nr:oligosaccharide translocation protein Rft1p [[Candida] railenensis]